MRAIHLGRKLCGLAAALLFLSSVAAQADRLVILPLSEAVVREPGQKAVIGYHAGQEIMILATVLTTDRPMEILEVLPLPSRPTFAAVSPQFLERLHGLLETRFPGEDSSHGALRGGPAEVVAQQRLGVHDLTVLHIDQSSGLSAFVDDYYKKRGITARSLTGSELSLIDSYVRQNCRYLVLDRVSLPGGATQVDPVLYRFQTDRLFYPLRTSNLLGHPGSVSLVVLTKRPATEAIRADFVACMTPEPNLYRETSERSETWVSNDFLADLQMDLRWTQAATLSRADLSGLDPTLAGMFGEGEVQCQMFRYLGPLDFSQDLWVRLP